MYHEKLYCSSVHTVCEQIPILIYISNLYSLGKYLNLKQTQGFSSLNWSNQVVTSSNSTLVSVFWLGCSNNRKGQFISTKKSVNLCMYSLLS